MVDPLTRAQDLLRLATDKGNATNGESAAAALQLAKLIAQHKLLDGRAGTNTGDLVDRITTKVAEAWEISTLTGQLADAVQTCTALRGENQRLAYELERQTQIAASYCKTFFDCGLASDPNDPGGLNELKRLRHMAKIAKAGRDSMERDLLELFDSGWTGGADAAAAMVGRRAVRVRQCIARLARNGQLRCSGSPQRRKYSSPLKGQRTEPGRTGTHKEGNGNG